MGNMYTSASLVKDVNNQIADSPSKGIVACRERCYPLSSNNFTFNNTTVTIVPTYQNQTQMHRSLLNKTTSLKRFNRWMTAIVLMITMMALPFGKSFGQSITNYTFATGTDGSLEDLSTGATTIMTGNNDDAAGTVTPIGFNFIFMGGTYTHFSANSNGQMLLHTSSTATAAASQQSSLVSGLAILAPFTGDNEVNNGIRIKTIGTAPNRKLVIEWNQFYVNFVNLTNAGNMQVWLQEGTGVITYVYGEIYNSASTSQTRSIFIASSNTATTAGSITINTAPTAPTFAASATLATNTIAAGSGLAVATTLINNIGSSSNTTRRFFSFTPPTAAVADPTTLTFTAVTGTTTTLNWIDNSTTEGRFIVTRANDAGFTTNVVTTSVASTTTAGTGTAYTSAQTGLTPGITYYYRVQAAAEAQVSGFLTGNQVTSPAATYYYVGAASGDIATAANWNTNPAGGGSTRSTALTSDILILDGAGTIAGASTTLTLSGAFSIGALQITNNTAVTLTSSSTTTRTLSLTGSAGDELSIPAGSSLTLNSGTQAAAIAFSTGAGMTGDISGTLSFAGSTANTLTTTGGTGTLVTVSSTGIVNLGNTVNSLVGSVATLNIANGATINSSGATTGAPPVPLATWGTTSNLIITGLTTSTTAPTNANQSFGNLTYNCPAASGTLSWFTTSTTGVIKGDLTITATGTGIFRALTSGTLTVNGNVIVNGGTLQSASSTGTLIVLGNTTIGASGTLNILAGTYSQRGTTFTNNGTLTGVATTSTLQLFSPTNIAQTFAGTGTVLTNVGVLSVQNTSGLTISHTNQIPVLRVNLFQGTVTGSNKITIGTGAALATTVQIGATGLPTAGGSFDAAPTFNLGTGTYTVLYQFETAARSTGFEIPATRTISAATIGNPNNITVSGGALSIGTLTLQAGNLITTASNLATITGTTTTSTTRSSYTSASATSSGTTITVGSTTNLFVGMNVTVTSGTGAFAANTVVTSIPSTTTFVVSATPTTPLAAAAIVGVGGWVNGPLAITLPVSLASGSTYTIPVGKGTYNPFLLVNPTTDAGTPPVIQAEVFDGNSGGTPGTLMGSINTSRYWTASLTTPGNFLNTLIRLTDTRGTQDAIANSSTLTGAYNQIGGVVSTLAATSITTSAPALTSLSGFYLMGNLGAATFSNLAITPTGNQCTNVLRTVTVTATPGGAAVNTVVINYSINGTAQTAIPMTNTSGNNWSGDIPTVIPANATVTWSVTATDANSLSASVTGTAYADEPLTTVNINVSANPTTLCLGNTINLVGSTGSSSTFNGARTAPTNIANTTPASYGLVFDVTTPFTLNSVDVFNGLTSSGTFVIQLQNNAGTALQTSTTFTAPAGTGVIGTSLPYTATLGWTIPAGTGYRLLVTSGTASLVRESSLGGFPYALGTAGSITSGYIGGTSTTYYYLYNWNITVATNTTSNYAWSWSLTGGASNPVATTASATIAPTTSGALVYTATITENGCSKTSADVNVTVNPIPDAPITTFDVNNPSTQCGLATPSVLVSNGSNGNYRWYLAPTGGSPLTENVSPFNLQVNSTLTNYPISANTIFYVAINDGTCESVRTPVYASVAIPDIITANATTLTGFPSGCVGSNITLTPVQTGTNQNYDFIWSTVAPEAGSGLETPVPITNLSDSTLTIAPTAAGTYTYRVDASVDGCNTFSTITVVVNNLPTITTATATPATICAGQPSTLAATSIVSSNYSNVSLGAGALTSTASGTSSVNYASPYSHYYGGYKGQYVVRASELAAVGINAGNINSLAFDVTTTSSTAFTGFTISLAQSAATVNTTVASTTFLTPTFTQVYTGNPTAGTLGLNTYTFGTGAGSASTFNWNGTSDIIVQVCWSNNNGGGTAAEVRYDNTTYISNAYYRVDNATPAATCSNASASGTASFRPKMVFAGTGANNLTSSLTWEWNPGAIAGSSVSVSPTGNTDYTVTATNTSTGCTNTSAIVAVTVNPLPEQPIVTNNNEQCGPGAPTATVATGGANGNGTFNWYSAATGGTLLQSSTSATYTTSISATTSFYVSEVGTNGCESARTQIDVVVNEADPLTLTVVEGATVCIGSPITLNVEQGGGNNSFEFTYSASPVLGSGIPTPIVTTDFSQVVTPSVAGTYIYTVSGSDAGSGCTSLSTVSLQVSALPVIDNVTASVTTICEGATPVVLSGFSATLGAGPQTLPTGYPASNATDPDDEELLNVSLGTGGSLLNNTSTCSTTGGVAANGLPASTLNQYSNYTALTAPTVTAGTTVPVSLTLGTCTGTYGRSATVYIDYNRNGAFDLPAEQAYFTGSVASGVANPTIQTGNISIPSTASAGVTLMRVVYVESTTSTAPNVTYTWGETEDYAINIIGTIPVNPAYTYTWNPGAISGSSVTVNPTTNTTYALTVTDAIGCSSTTGTAGNPASIDITVNPAPVAPTGTNSSQCGSGVPTVAVTGAGGTYKWYSAATGGTLLQTGGTTYTTSINTTTDFYVSETNALGCEGPRSAAITATVTAPPTLVITPSASEVCLGTGVNLNTAPNSDASYVNFTWSVLPTTGAGLSTTTGSTTSVLPTAAGTYVYSVAANDGIDPSLGGCASTASVSITVNPNPVISSASATPSVICAGGTSTLTAQSVIGTPSTATIGTQTTTEFGGSVYRFGFGTGDFRHQILLRASELTASGFSAGDFSALTFNITSLGSGSANNYTISMANVANTASTTTFLEPAFTTVYSEPTYTPVSGNNVHTFSSPFTWDGTSNVLINICYNVSTFGGTSTVAATTPAFLANSNLLGSAGACTATTGSTFANRPLVRLTYTGQDLTGSLGWSWNPGSFTNSTVNVTPATSTNYSVTATNTVTGCSTTQTDIAVTVQAVGGTATASTTTVCAGGTVNFTSTATGGGPFTYSWSDGTTVVGTNATLTANPTTNTTYTLTITDVCGNPFSAAPITITVNALPTVSVNEPGTTICAPAVYNLSANTNAASPAYQWLLGTTNIGGANAATVTATSTGNYAVQVTDGVTGCINTSAAVSVTINAQPPVVTVTPNNPTICSGTSVVLTANASTAGTATLGTATTLTTATTQPTAFCNRWAQYWNQTIYTVAELQAAGLSTGSSINSITYTTTTQGDANDNANFSIRIGNTANSVLSAFQTTGFTTVFGPATYTHSIGANLITFSTPFVWDGTSNIIIDVRHDGADLTNNAITRFTAAADNKNFSAITSTSSSTTTLQALVASGSVTGTASTSRLNIILGTGTSPASYTWDADPTLSTTTAAVTTATPTSTTTYNVTATSSFGCTNTGSVTVTTTPATSFTTNAAPLNQTLLVNDPSPSPITVAATGTGTVTYAWFSNTTNSTTGGTALGVTTPSFTPSSATIGTSYYYCVASSDCGPVTSAIATVVVTNANSWKGNGTTEWTTPSNWTTNQVPTATTDGIIPVGNTPYPVLTSSVSVRNLTIDDGATVTVGANTLTINGAFTSSGAGGLSTSNASTITTTGTTDLRFVSGANTVKDLNINSGTATLTNELNIAVGTSPNFGTVTVATGATLNSNGNLVIKSNANGTARVAANNSSNYITGDVTVERHIPANSKRAWRLLSVPTKGAQTVKQSWQENQQGNTNTTPGFGTFLTANVPAANLVATGFDFTTPSANMQRYNSTTQTWVNITSTNNSSTDRMETNKAYFLFVRGSRAVTPSASVAASDPTVLRTKGTLYQGTLTAEAVSVAPGKFEPVGNLYASAIDFTGLTRTGGVSSTFYIWDPKAGNSTVLGTYQTFNPLNDYKPFLPGSYGTAVGGANPFRRNTLIESGQGFMVTATGSAGTITLQESAKVIGTGQQVFRPTAGIQKLKTNLYIVDGANTTLADGNLAAFDAAFSNSIDGDDAYKFANPGENFGINRSNTKLVVEARQPVVAKDTVFFDMWNMTSTNYRLEFIPTEMQVPGLTAVLKDKYLGTTTPIDLFAPSVNHDFAIDANAASKDINRFSVIFTQAASGSLPVNFISLSANRTGAAVKVDWKVASENGIRNYEVQRSTDGRTFNTAGTVTATGNSTSREIAYTWLDAAPFSGTSFYRVKSVGVAGDIKYTNIAKIAGGDVKPGYTISPNPVEGSTVNLTFKNQTQGRYNINLITNDGRVIYTTIAEHAGGNSTQILNLPSFIARGAYQIEIVSPDKKKDVQTLFINTTK